MILRAHHLICLLGFRGLGYSDEFAANMSRIVEQLQSSPLTVVEIVREPDDICTSCPFIKDNACHHRGPQSEEAVRHRDLAAMAKLGLVSGDKLPWNGVVGRIRNRLNVEDLEQICLDCEWLPLGYCVEGIKALQNE
jgi:hypothetical protein